MKSVAQTFSGVLLKAALPALAVCGFLTTMSGCARPYGVPAFTQLVAEAPAGKTASFQAPDDGSVWVGGPGHPGQPRYIVYSGLIRRGEVLTVDQSSGRLLLNGRPLDATIEGGNKAFYQVWYQEAFYDWY
ncbi:MAG TPA: hypothetical protein VGI81_00105 [Tepidisphaeraceae bacterium]|jgi:hypothetical protein